MKFVLHAITYNNKKYTVNLITITNSNAMRNKRESVPFSSGWHRSDAPTRREGDIEFV